MVLYIVIQNGNLHSPHKDLESAKNTIRTIGGWNSWHIVWWSPEDNKFHDVAFNGGKW